MKDFFSLKFWAQKGGVHINTGTHLHSKIQYLETLASYIYRAVRRAIITKGRSAGGQL